MIDPYGGTGGRVPVNGIPFPPGYPLYNPDNLRSTPYYPSGEHTLFAKHFFIKNDGGFFFSGRKLSVREQTQLVPKMLLSMLEKNLFFWFTKCLTLFHCNSRPSHGVPSPLVALHLLPAVGPYDDLAGGRLRQVWSAGGGAGAGRGDNHRGPCGGE